MTPETLHVVLLAPDRHGTGTHALIVDAAAGIEFKFGDGSLISEPAHAGPQQRGGWK